MNLNLKIIKCFFKVNNKERKLQELFRQKERVVEVEMVKCFDLEYILNLKRQT